MSFLVRGRFAEAIGVFGAVVISQFEVAEDEGSKWLVKKYSFFAFQLGAKSE